MKVRTLATTAVLAAVLCAIPAGAQAQRGFTLGVAAGEVTDDSAVVWGHTTRSGTGLVTVYTDRRGSREVFVRRVRATASNDNTVQARITRLDPDREYRFFFTFGRNKSATGRFRTA